MPHVQIHHLMSMQKSIMAAGNIMNKYIHRSTCIQFIFILHSSWTSQ